MNPEDLVTCIDKAFERLDRPSFQEMSAPDAYVDDSFINGVGSSAWQDLQPLRDYVGDGGEIVLFSAKAYQYYIPAYLVALVDESGEEFYLNGVLDSLWYDRYPPVEDRSRIRDHFDPNKSLGQTLYEIGIQMPHLTDQERKGAAETRVSIAKRLAYLKETTGHDYLEPSTSYLRVRWEERMPLLTKPQKACIAQVLLHVLERTTDEFDGPRIRTMLDKYWGAFLVEQG
jgi:hypothetical protein